ncbi:MAG: hypothetical protein KDK97_25040, partial [Verrucomicrobiales bacterium]|nr:hypothetical protein [Verrucomicrobiales bacterium]
PHSAPAPPPFQTWLATHYPANLQGQWVDPDGDEDGDGIKNQIEYAYGFSPQSYDVVDNFSISQVAGPAASTDLTVTFRRDESATDLTYLLQVSSNLIDWTTIARSTAGGVATGENGGTINSDATLIGTIHLVSVTTNLAAGTNGKKFVRLKVDRQP